MKENCCIANELVSNALRLSLGIVLLVMGAVKLFNFADVIRDVTFLFADMALLSNLSVLFVVLAVLAEIIIGLSLILRLRVVGMFVAVVVYFTVLSAGMILANESWTVPLYFVYILAAVLGIYATGQRGGCCAQPHHHATHQPESYAETSMPAAEPEFTRTAPVTATTRKRPAKRATKKKTAKKTTKKSTRARKKTARKRR